MNEWSLGQKNQNMESWVKFVGSQLSFFFEGGPIDKSRNDGVSNF